MFNGKDWNDIFWNSAGFLLDSDSQSEDDLNKKNNRSPKSFEENNNKILAGNEGEVAQ